MLGVINSPKAIAAVQLYHDLYQNFQPPGLSNSFFPEMNDAFTSGKAVMIMNYFAFLPALGNKGTDPNYYDKVGYFVNPAGPDWKQFAALGGQGMSVISYIRKDRQAAALDFIKWFAQDKVQARWAELGGYTCNVKALKSDAFLKSQPYNPAFAQTMTMVKDFWNIPSYGPILAATQKYLHKFIVENVGTAKEAMDGVTGADATRLLDRVVTRNVGKSRPGQVLYTSWCDAHGKVIDDGTISRFGEQSYRLTSAEPGLRWLHRNAFGMQVAIEEVSEAIGALALQGPLSRAVLNSVARDPVDGLGYFRVMDNRIADVDIQVSRTGYTGDLGYELWMDNADALPVWDALIAGGDDFGITPCGILAMAAPMSPWRRRRR